MKNFLPVLIFVALLYSAESNAQILRPFAQRFYNASVRGGIVYVANSIVSTTGIGSGSPGTGEVPPAGSTTNNGGFAIDIDVDNTTITKLNFNSVWNYYCGLGAAPPNNGGFNWTQPAYVLPAGWNTGATGTGAGKYGYRGTQATCVRHAVVACGGSQCNPTAACNKNTAFYFRQNVNFTAPELASFTSVILNLFRDDGVVVYINGVERAANNMPAGRTYATLASSNIAVGAAESVTFNLSPAFFVVGANTIAVEIHTSQVQSADMSFDMQVQGFDDQGTHNSTTADLNLASCSNVLFAGLYWGAGEGSNAGNTAWITGETTCKLKLPGAGTYTTITSTQTDYWNKTLIAGYAHTGYQCFKDITALVNATAPNGTYTVGNVLSPLGIGDAYGGWTIVIVYGNPSLPSRNLTVFDGCGIVKSGSPPVDIGINGFLTPPSGPVSCELGAVVFDGDRTSLDSFKFKQLGAAAFYNLTPNSTALLNDMWNSTIAYKGTVVATRNPAFNNTLGYDASIIDLPNAGNLQLGNSKISATVRFASPSENYIAQVLTTSISQYNPTYSFEKTATDINGGTLAPGDSILYKIKYSNQGNDSSTNTLILDNLPSGTAYIPGSIKIGVSAKTDGSGDDQAEYDFANNRIVFRLGVGANSATGGRIGPGQTDSVQFKVVVTSSCAILSCIGSSIRNSARINYGGKLSGAVLFDSSGVNTAGCIVQGPIILPVSGPCSTPRDTVLVNKCPTLSLVLPYARYAGYTFYSAKPFIPANIYNQYIPVTTTGIYWGYFDNGSGCSDTVRLAVIITSCPDIDDDNDGIPDYVEFDNPLSLAGGATPNWNNPAYPGYRDYNADLVNDNFDWGADADNDGIPNFYDTDFWIPFVDVNNDGVNDKADKDLDGIPNQYDLDSDNDGIPDTVESYGVDTNGDGLIDNYTDTDNDGFSQNADANNTGVNGSGVGLGPIDLDGDGVPNYLDLDSDNDGIPDLVEVLGTDVNNDGMIDAFTDVNSDGIADNYILGSALLITGVDLIAPFGRADNWPNKNLDRDLRPNAYDLDSDGDGIADVTESGLPDADLNGLADGTIGTNGWSTTVSAMPALNLRNTDGSGNYDFLDIDSDDDGIPDNIEGQTTAGYLLPTLTDADGDGIMSPYDNLPATYGGSGIFVYDHDGDGTPDYRDLDTDADGLNDRVEGNDFNLNGLPDDNVTLTGLDTDGDGLDNRFDSLNSVTNIKGTSYLMGNGGSFTGDATPGSKTTVQRTNAYQTDRDWRYSGYVLPVQFLSFNGLPNDNNVLLSWTIITEKDVNRFEIERSVNNNDFIKTVTVSQPVLLQIEQSFSATDDITGINNDVIYYRLKVIGKDGSIKYSNILAVRKVAGSKEINIAPNPVNDYVSIKFYSDKDAVTSIVIIDNTGKIILNSKQKIFKGFNSIQFDNLHKFSNGVYQVKMQLNENTITKNFVIRN
ncbi:MAG: T9SS type A sorting domain-containing protein [Ferruginibacter sp.]